ncbi:MAG TPA: 1-deoxy-D-xylulose-5-phosphate reductoisomerase [Candidatus Hydrogenedens sp.]|nr:1-deoxy-D-xylulose-5-phosphate reductoisomerase [Candidatus Hydrogenedens sp.]
MNFTSQKKITILGSTGSIGCNALEVIRSFPDKFKVVGLSAHSNIALLKKQIKEFQPEFVVIDNLTAVSHLKHEFNGLNILYGEEGLNQIASVKVDILLSAIVGAIGLCPLLAAIESNNNIALANKEPLVMAGKLITQKAYEHSVKLIPVDSEHSAIFQCLMGQDINKVEKIYLTASGGPFYNKSTKELENVTPDEAIKHPTWKMGKKISVDSATLMNKGLEIIEAMWLFDLDEKQIDVVIHPQSVVHGLVEFVDGNILAHFGPTDMRLPILFSLTYPDRTVSPLKKLNIKELSNLTFDYPDTKKFPCLQIARTVAKTGGIVPTILNASNEVAVQAFCEGRVKFTDIYKVVQEALDKISYTQENYDLETILQIDKETRKISYDIIKQLT